MESALKERPRPGPRCKLNGKEEAHLIAVACSKPAEGHARWTLRLLADKAVELGFADSMSYESVRRTLKKKNELKPWRKKEWCIPKVSAAFVACMEDVLDLYEEPYDPKRPAVCFDETSKQLAGRSGRRYQPNQGGQSGSTTREARAVRLRVQTQRDPEPIHVV